MTEPLEFGAFHANDLDAMVALDKACFAPEFLFTRSAMRRFAEARKARVLLACAGDSLAGFVIVHLEHTAGERVAYLVTLDVAEVHRRRGVARRLLAEMLDQALAGGCLAMMLHVSAGNSAAIGFYEQHGFTRIRSVPGFYGVGLDAALYRLELD